MERAVGENLRVERAGRRPGGQKDKIRSRRRADRAACQAGQPARRARQRSDPRGNAPTETWIKVRRTARLTKFTVSRRMPRALRGRRVGCVSGATVARIVEVWQSNDGWTASSANGSEGRRESAKGAYRGWRWLSEFGSVNLSSRSGAGCCTPGYANCRSASTGCSSSGV